MTTDKPSTQGKLHNIWEMNVERCENATIVTQSLDLHTQEHALKI